MAGKTILVTIWDRGKLESPLWEVYRHISLFENECLASFVCRRQAEDYAIEIACRFCVPLFCGSELDKDDLLRKLSKETGIPENKTWGESEGTLENIE